MTTIVKEPRDTDSDWRRLGETDPYWGVLTVPQFRRDVMREEDREAFYDYGRKDIAHFSGVIARWTGHAPSGGRALDFGCGVGRLTEAMADQVDEAFGYDISDAMVTEARRRSGRPSYSTFLPDGPFDWINSYIVFQHIPPERGMKLLEALLSRLAPGGAVSLQFTTAMHPAPPPPPPPAMIRHVLPAPIRTAWRWTAWFAAVMINPDTAPPRPPRAFNPHTNLPVGTPPVGSISMFDYDLTNLMRTFRTHGVADLAMIATDHGHPGYMFVGRRTADAAPQ